MKGQAADVFLDHFAIVPRAADRDLVEELGAAFAALPYENLTKLIKKHTLPPGPERRRLPAEVLSDHLELGAGGTCFALTRLFAEVLARVGVRSFPVLCDAPRRPAQHCALIVLLDGRPHLLDPGYLIHSPVPVDAGSSSPGDRVVVRRSAERDSVFDLSTFATHRYRFALQPAEAARFEAVWDASFEWTMMNGVHLCAPHGDGYAYVHGTTLRLTTSGSRTNLNLRGREREELGRSFGVAAELVDEAYRLVQAERANCDRRVGG